MIVTLLAKAGVGTTPIPAIMVKSDATATPLAIRRALFLP
jgi:hypothetical protein